MAEEKVQGQIEEPEVKEQTPAAGEVKDVDAFMAELEKAGVSTPSQLQGKLINAQGFDKVQSERDMLARELSGLRDEVTKLKTRAPDTSAYDNDYDNPGSTINIEDVVVKAMRKERAAEREEQVRQQQAIMQDWARIQGDEDYHLVQEVWESKLKDPNFVFKINSGQLNPVEAYTSTVRGYYKNMLLKAKDTITGLKGGKPVQTPHLEEGGQYSVPKQEVEEKTVKDKLRAKAQKAQLSEQDELDLLDEAVGSLV